ncbi:MAG: DUF1670 domain-containing protein [Candidatus Methanospirareceae archaeon]
MTDRFTNLTYKVSLVMSTVVEVSNENLSTFNRRIETQFYNELRRDYAFPRAVCRSLSELFVLLSESTKTIARHIQELENNGEVVPTRGSWKDIGPGVSHKKRILELYLKGDEYTDIERKTNHTEEACGRYIKAYKTRK